MCDEPLRTWVRTDAGWRDFQQFMIRDRAAGVVHEVAFVTPARASLVTSPAARAIAGEPDGTTQGARPVPAETPAAAQAPPPTPEVLAALASARAVIVGPSNPVISIWPILKVLGETLTQLAAPVVCVSPVVGGEVLKGPTAAFMAAYDQPVSAAGVSAFYERMQPGLVDGIVTDEPFVELPALRIDTAMPEEAARARVAEQTLAFAATLTG
jgi:LPPG:FO 2-phospho-L-lactate transferase